MSIIIRIVALLTLTIPFSTQASGIDAQENTANGMLYMEQGNSLVANLPAAGTRELLGKVQQLKANLKEMQTQAITDVKTSKFSGKDTFIAAVMPGGLIYAANKKRRHKDAKAKLTDVTAQLDSLEGDIDMLKSETSKQTLAMAF